MSLHEVMAFAPVERSRRLVNVYYPNVGKIERAALYIGEDGKISIDKLARKGYVISKYNPEEYGNKILVLKGVEFIDFKESLFINDNEIVQMVFFPDGDVHYVIVDVVPRCKSDRLYRVYSCGRKDYFSLYQYEKSFVFMRRSNN